MCFVFIEVVDMRWGVREEAQDDHLTVDLCMQEIHECQRISVGPTFVVSIHGPAPLCFSQMLTTPNIIVSVDLHL